MISCAAASIKDCVAGFDEQLGNDSEHANRCFEVGGVGVTMDCEQHDETCWICILRNDKL